MMTETKTVATLEATKLAGRKVSVHWQEANIRACISHEILAKMLLSHGLIEMPEKENIFKRGRKGRRMFHGILSIEALILTLLDLRFIVLADGRLRSFMSCPADDLAVSVVVDIQPWPELERQMNAAKLQAQEEQKQCQEHAPCHVLKLA